jgi:hypothetical protein
MLNSISRVNQYLMRKWISNLHIEIFNIILANLAARFNNKAEMLF